MGLGPVPGLRADEEDPAADAITVTVGTVPRLSVQVRRLPAVDQRLKLLPGPIFSCIDVLYEVDLYINLCELYY